MSIQLYPHIITDPDILAGKPVVEGTQVPASALVEQVAAGKPFDEIAREHGVTVEDVRAALGFAAQRVGDVPPSEMPAPSSFPDTGVHADQIAVDGPKSPREPVTELGRRLSAIRERIVASGAPLLAWDELDAEMDEMRRRDLDERDAR